MATLEVIASGYGLIEGPRVDERDRLYFSDVPNGGVYRRSPNGDIETLIPKRKGVGGTALNEGGGIVCSGRSLIYWNEQTRTSRDLFTEWEGRPLKGLNDIQPDRSDAGAWARRFVATGDSSGAAGRCAANRRCIDGAYRARF